MSTRARILAGAAALPLVVAGCSSNAKSPAAGPATSASVMVSGALGIAHTSIGSVLTDAHGRTIYRFAPDAMGHSTCTATCASYWPPVPAPAGAASPGGSVTATVGSITRPDGTKQLTVDGYPVYTYVGDKSAGATSGQGLNLSGGLWWVLNPSGAEITTPAGGGASSSSRAGYGGAY